MKSDLDKVIACLKRPQQAVLSDTEVKAAIQARLKLDNMIFETPCVLDKPMVTTNELTIWVE